jgi:hypothetical protein
VARVVYKSKDQKTDPSDRLFPTIIFLFFSKRILSKRFQFKEKNNKNIKNGKRGKHMLLP